MNTFPEFANDHRLIPGLGMTGAEFYAKARAEEEEFRTNMPPIPACPAWCTKEPEHLYEYGFEYTRWHESASSGHASVSQEERNVGGAVSFGPLVVTQVLPDDTEEITAAQARMRAAELLNAADLIDQIKGVSA